MRGVCKICGCTMHNPCFNHRYGFCWWSTTEEDICSHCNEKQLKEDPNTIHCVHGMEFPVLTVHQPYALMLVKGLKKIEYRNWKLPEKYVGQRIFIHAGRMLETKWDKRYSDKQSFEECLEEAYVNDMAEMIIGSVVFGESKGPRSGSFYGEPYPMYEWPVFEPIRLTEPLENIPGKQRIWKIGF